MNMKNAAVYCRVSTDSQEKEGTSLQTQLENCFDYCKKKDYEVTHKFSESFSGLSLERTELDKLRELVRAEAIDVVVVYCLDRLSRNATHGVILRDELDKHHVLLESVTEDIDKTPLGEAITYLRGTFSQIEAEKIRERTMRGRKARAQQGRVPVGGYSRTYGYDYISVREKNGGRRIINENEAQWVRQMFDWLVNDGMSCRTIAVKLNSLQIPTKHGNYWSRKVVHQILSNPAYAGVTLYNQGEPIELPDVTPPTIDKASFDAAQKQLRRNLEKAKRNMRQQYLLHGHIRCRQCGKPYRAQITTQNTKRNTYRYRRYVCLCATPAPDGPPMKRCHNKGWAADKLEALVWTQIERILSNPSLMITEIEKQRQGIGDASGLETELSQIERRLGAINREQAQLLQWAIKDFPEDMVVSENKKLNAGRESLKARKAELEQQIKASQEAAITLPKLERCVELIREKLSNLDFETKRMALEMLDIIVWIDGYNVEVTGVMPVSDYVIATPQVDG
jgi:site-specific DNA recombinase